MEDTPKPHAKYRVKGTTSEPFDTLQARTVVHLDELFATANPDGLIVQKVLEAAAAISEVWNKHKDNIELVSEEGQ